MNDKRIGIARDMLRWAISLALLVMLMLSVGLTVPPLRLTAPRSYVTGPLPSQVIPMHLDGDGDLDVIVLSVEALGASHLQFFRNEGDGSLTLAGSMAAGGSGRLAVADFNNDALLDLVQVSKAGTTTGTLTLYRRTGPFTFSASSQSLPFAPTYVAAGRLDNTGGPDLAISDSLLPQVRVYLGDGAGNFTWHGTYDSDLLLGDFDGNGTQDCQCAFSNVDIACADIDRDGLDDLVMTHYFKRRLNSTSSELCRNYGQTRNDTVYLRNLGGGTLAARQVVNDLYGRALSLGDIDNDVDLDIVTAGTATSGPDLDALLVIRNLGAGAFGAAQQYPSGGGILSAVGVRLADVDGDGRLDAALRFGDEIAGTPGDKPAASWSLLRNTGGAFGVAERLCTGASPTDIALANLDGAPGPEALTTAGDDQRLVVHYNEAGRYRMPPVVSLIDPQATSRGFEVSDIAVADVTADGLPDLAVIGNNDTLSGEGPDTLFILQGEITGPSNLPSPQDLPRKFPRRLIGGPLAGSTAADLGVIFIGDTLVDPAMGVGLSLGVAGGIPGLMQFQALPGMPTDVAAFDLYGDGVKDLAVLRLRGSSEGLTCVLSVVQVDNSGALTYLGDLLLGSDDPLSGDVRQSYVLTSADMDNDGWDDLVAVTMPTLSYYSVVTVILYKGGLDFYLGGEYMTVGATVTDILAADLDGDALPEVALTRTPSSGDGSLEVFPNTGGGTLGAAASYNVGTGPTRAAAARIDTDTATDLVVCCDGSNEVTLLRNDGTGAFPVQERYMPAGGSDAMVVADLDLDGDIDVAVLHDAHVTMPNQPRHRATVSTLWNRIRGGPADLDGDGHVNIFDIFVIAEHWNAQAGDPNYDPAYDIDKDGAINIFDIFVIAEYWNT